MTGLRSAARLPLSALAVLLLLAVPAARAVNVWCESKNMVYTKGKAQRAIPGCTECMAAAGDPDGDFNCFYCAHNRSPIWMKSGGKDVLTECKPLAKVSTTNCKPNTVYGAQCLYCEMTANDFAANKCTRCKETYGFDDTGKCSVLLSTSGDGLKACRRTSMNSGCTECHPDGTCRKCASTGAVPMPTGSYWLDAGYPETQCVAKGSATTAGTLLGYAKTILGSTAGTFWTTNCGDVDYNFDCIACVPPYCANPPCALTGATLTAAIKTARGYSMKDAGTPAKYTFTCVANLPPNAAAGLPLRSPDYPGGTGCDMTVPYAQYCKRCGIGTAAARKKCLAAAAGGGCTGNRGIDWRGQCSLNCKALFGIGCSACEQTSANADPVCTATDSLFKSGR